MESVREQQAVQKPAAETSARTAPATGAPAILQLQKTAGNRAVTRALARTIELRNVGRGEASGFGRRTEFVDRLNALCPSLLFTLEEDRHLRYELLEGSTPNFFERSMMRFIDQTAVLPLRLTNRHGLMGSRATGFTERVQADSFTTGYVDIDDMMAADDLGFQSILVHFLTERAATSNYARRIGTNTFTNAEFDRGHSRGITAETEILRDFLGDPSVRFINEPQTGPLIRVFRNSRGDVIRHRFTQGTGDQRGVDISRMEVRRADGTVQTLEEYRDFLAAQAAPAPPAGGGSSVGVTPGPNPPP